MSERETLRLVDRLRGIYVLPINDGLGPLDGSMVFERTFITTSLQQEAADVIEALERGGHRYVDDLLSRLALPTDPFGLGRSFTPPIQNEAIAAIHMLLSERHEGESDE